MKVDELTVQIPFIRVRRGLNVEFQRAGVQGDPGGPPTPLTNCLARAHALDRALETMGPGALAREAKGSKVSRQRLAAVHALVYLAPDLQEEILMGSQAASRVNFNVLLRIARMILWSDQREAWREAVAACLPNRESNMGTKASSGNTGPCSDAPKDPEKPRTSPTTPKTADGRHSEREPLPDPPSHANP